ncbi:COMM domain-containing protein 5-like [Ptychodera flava]|uniref:COMM domain-containing protein 5-like n=1 Tax=Ptychodera flava TaxID=63121 RepID=UPI003969BCD8
MSMVMPPGGGVMERTLFVGARIPQEVKAMVKPLQKLDKDNFRKLLRVAVSSMEGNEITEEVFQKLQTNQLNEEIIGVIYSGLCTLLRCALRLPQTSLKADVFKEDLKELKIPDDFIVDLASAVYGSKRAVIDDASIKQRTRLPSLERLKWRVDVAISTSVLNRVLEPTIMMEMTLSNGSIHNFEIPVSKFHELRYNVAYVLKEMEDLEKRSILKIQD